MMKPLLISLLLVLSRTTSLTFPQSGGEATVSLSVGSDLIINLKTNPTTGYDWFLKKVPDCMEATEPRFLAQDQGATHLVGAPTVKEFTFRASSSCESTISLEYKRPWEKEDPKATATVRINIYDDKDLL